MLIVHLHQHDVNTHYRCVILINNNLVRYHGCHPESTDYVNNVTQLLLMGSTQSRDVYIQGLLDWCQNSTFVHGQMQGHKIQIGRARRNKQ